MYVKFYSLLTIAFQIGYTGHTPIQDMHNFDSCGGEGRPSRHREQYKK